MMCGDNWVHYGLKVGFLCSHVTRAYCQHYTHLSGSTDYIRYLSSIFCECVSKIKSIRSMIFMLYIGQCGFSFRIFSLDGFQNACTSDASIISHF